MTVWLGRVKEASIAKVTLGLMADRLVERGPRTDCGWQMIETKGFEDHVPAASG